MQSEFEGPERFKGVTVEQVVGGNVRSRVSTEGCLYA